LVYPSNLFKGKKLEYPADASFKMDLKLLKSEQEIRQRLPVLTTAEDVAKTRGRFGVFDK